MPRHRSSTTRKEKEKAEEKGDDGDYKDWSIEEVLEWLRGVNPAIGKKYERKWREEGVDGAILEAMDTTDMQVDLGMSRMHSKRIISALNQLKSSKRIKIAPGDVATSAASSPVAKTEQPTTTAEDVNHGDDEEEEDSKPKANKTRAPAVRRASTRIRGAGRKRTADREEKEEEKEEDAPVKKEDTPIKKEEKEEDAPIKKEEKATEDEDDGTAQETEEKEMAKKKGVAEVPSDVPEDVRSKEIEICFSFDTTGSMYACLGQVKRKITDLVDRLLRDVPHMKIALIAHGDYQDEGETYLLKKCNFSCDKDILVDWVQNVQSTHGYDGEEAYEYVLREARSLAWSPTCQRRSLVMIGDSNPHTTSNNKYDIDWREQCRELAKQKVRIHGVHALGYSFSRDFYQEMGQITGGLYLELSQFNAIRDLILGVAMAENNDTIMLSQLEQEVRDEGRMTRAMKRTFDSLHGREPSAGAEVPEGLQAVQEGRFQVMDIDEKIPIKKFALSQGLIFKTGRGFYEFTKPEKISLKKEIVLQEKSTGDFYTGDKAREMLGVSEASAQTKLEPADFNQFRVFVQSTSYNRNLMPGTKFLYEVDSDR